MYKHYFKLTREPFGMTPDTSMLYLAPQHEEALAGLMYAVQSAKGLVVLTGEAGTGKSTLLARLVQSLPPTLARISLVVNPALTGREFMEMALLGWGFADPPASKTQQLFVLRKMLLQARDEKKLVLLIVDEAHALSVDLLEEIRLLGNFEESGRKLLQIVLAGQSELASLLNRDDLRQFKQRIAVRLRLKPLSTTEVKEYIRFRWLEAGGIEPPFTAEAIAAIAQSSSGIPRVVNALCDNALMLAFAETSDCVTAGHVREVCVDLDLPYGSTPQSGDAPTSILQDVRALPLSPAPAQPSPAPANHGSAARPPLEISPALLTTLEQYGGVKAGKSLWSRCAGILGFAS